MRTFLVVTYGCVLLLWFWWVGAYLTWPYLPLEYQLDVVAWPTLALGMLKWKPSTHVFLLVALATPGAVWALAWWLRMGRRKRSGCEGEG